MNKKLKIVLIILLSIIVLLLVAAASFMFKFKSEVSKMSSMETKKIFENVFVVQDSFANLYLIKSAEGYIAIDAGYDAENVKSALKKLNIAESEIKAIFLTHSDSDHTGAVKIFNNAKVYASEDEAPMLEGKKNKAFFVSNKLNARFQTLKDHEVLKIGGVDIKIIFTPGHTIGSASYMVNDGYLFTGDTLSIKNGKIDVFNEFFNMDTAAEKISIEKIKSIPGVKYIFTAHYGMLKI